MTKDFFIASTKSTPEVSFSAQDRAIKFKGRSNTENPLTFYQPVFDLLNECKECHAEDITMEFRISYMNTTSSKFIYAMLKSAAEMERGGTKVSAKWYYEPDDEDSFEVGEDLSKASQLKFDFIESEIND